MCRERQAAAAVGRHLGIALAAAGDLGPGLAQAQEGQQLYGEDEGVAGGQVKAVCNKVYVILLTKN